VIPITTNLNYKIEFIAGDTEYIRLNLKDTNGNVVPVSVNTTFKLGIKRKIADTEYIVEEKEATLYDYHKYSQPFTIEFKFTSEETLMLLNYDNKERVDLTCVYDVEYNDVQYSSDDKLTVLAGELLIRRGISGRATPIIS